MSIGQAVQPLVLLRNRLAVERRRPWLVKVQNSLRLALAQRRPDQSSPCGNILTYWDIGKHRSELYS
jgi:hypothetical protein